MLKSLVASIPLLSILTGCSAAVVDQEHGSVLNHTMKSLGGDEIDLAKKYAGKVVLFVNVASKCGFTPQYESLQALHEKYADQGLAIVGIPCNQFGGQEPGTSEQIGEFCKLNYGVTFDLLEKSDVKGSNQTALYTDLSTAAGGHTVKWNFEKFLVGKDGRLIAHFGSMTKPSSQKLLDAVEAALAAE